jgi:uncharacterized membrane protein YqjE
MALLDARDDAGRPDGLFASIRRLLATALSVVQTRVELLTTELEEEIHRASVILLWALIALFFGSLAVLMLALSLLIAFWDTHRLLVALLLTGVFLAAAALTASRARAQLKARPGLLAASLGELRRDVDALGKRPE